MTAGIYAMTNTATGRVYVGSSVDIERRWKLHRSHLERGNHPSPGVRQDCRDHGVDAFTFAVLEVTDATAAMLAVAEQRWLDRYRTVAYNSTRPIWRARDKETVPVVPLKVHGIICHLADILREQRMTIAELQRRTGLTYANLHALSHGKSTRLDLATLDKLCAALGVGVGELLEHVPEAQP